MRDLLLLGAGLLVLTLASGCEPNDTVSACQGIDLAGRPASPFDGPEAITVLVFIGCDCPISNRYMPTLRSLNERYAHHSVRFWLVYPDPDVSADQVQLHLAEYGPGITGLRDPGHDLVQTARVTTVPEAAVFVRHNGRRILTYHGSIDDQFVDFGVARARATKHYLHDVLESVLAGRIEVFPSLPAIGCPIPNMR